MQSKHKNAQCKIYYNNDKCFLVLVIYMIVMFYFFFIQKAEIKRFKKIHLAKIMKYYFLFLLKVGLLGLLDQQINFVLPKVFPLKFVSDHFYIAIIHKSTFSHWNITTLPYLEMFLINMIKLLFLFFLIFTFLIFFYFFAMFDVASCDFRGL